MNYQFSHCTCGCMKNLVTSSTYFPYSYICVKNVIYNNMKCALTSVQEYLSSCTSQVLRGYLLFTNGFERERHEFGGQQNI